MLPQVDREDLPSKCKSVAGIDKILLGEMEKHVGVSGRGRGP